jgi:hypothetical protein
MIMGGRGIRFQSAKIMNFSIAMLFFVEKRSLRRRLMGEKRIFAPW